MIFGIHGAAVIASLADDSRLHRQPGTIFIVMPLPDRPDKGDAQNRECHNRHDCCHQLKSEESKIHFLRSFLFCYFTTGLKSGQQIRHPIRLNIL